MRRPVALLFSLFHRRGRWLSLWRAWEGRQTATKCLCRVDQDSKCPRFVRESNTHRGRPTDVTDCCSVPRAKCWDHCRSLGSWAICFCSQEAVSARPCGHWTQLAFDPSVQRLCWQWQKEGASPLLSPTTGSTQIVQLGPYFLSIRTLLGFSCPQPCATLRCP